MDGVVSLLLFGAFLFFMMRYGCGAHMSHGRRHGRHESSKSESPRITKDPVCGMEVAADSGYSRVIEGREFWFCSRECLDKFDAGPNRYAA
jgi:YHS domain-containing protein